MKQVFIRRGKIIVEEVPAPLIIDNHVLVEVAYSLISAGTEVSNLQQSGKPLLRQALEQPEKIKKLTAHLLAQGINKTLAKVQEKVDSDAVVGYSCAGVVIQVGAGVTGIQPGDRVACAGAGMANHAELNLVPKNLVIKVPENCHLKDAASVALGSIAMQGVRRAEPRLGETIAIIGLGLLGQITIQLLKTAGCHVIGIDIDQRRVNLARQIGADYAFEARQVDIGNEVRHLTHDFGVDGTIITAAASGDTIVQQAMEITRKKGRVIVVGAVGLGLKRSPFYEKEIDFLISCSYGPGRYDPRYETQGLDYPYAYVRWTESRNMEEYLRLIAEKKIQLDPILERQYELAEASKAYEELQNAIEKPLGILLRYPSSNRTAGDGKLRTKINLGMPLKAGKINVAVIGVGNFARAMHLPNLQKLSDRYHIQAVVDADGPQAKMVAEKYSAEYATTSAEEVLNDSNIQMVMITTRHHLHAKLAIQAAKAGKAIFVEKPMALNFNELNEVECVLRETGVPYMVGFNRRFSPAARRLKELISGHQNPLIMLYRVNAGYLPLDHWTQTQEGGGRIIGEACHMLDVFHYWVDEARTVEVVSTEIVPQTKHIQPGDNKVITVRYEDGSVSTLLYTSLGASSFSKEYVEIFTDGKVYVIDDYRALRVFGTSEKGWFSNIQDKGHLEELRRFSDCVSGLSEPPICLDSLVEVTRNSFIAAGLTESITGKPVPDITDGGV